MHSSRTRRILYGLLPIVGSGIFAFLVVSRFLNSWPYVLGANAKIAQQGVTVLRSEMELGEFRAIYAEADESLRKKYSEDDFTRLMVSFQRSLGSVQKADLRRKTESWPFSKEEYVTLDYETTWSNDEGGERFVFAIRHGHALLNSYVLSAPFPPISF